MRLPTLRRRLLLAMGLPATLGCVVQSNGGGGGNNVREPDKIGNQVPDAVPGAACIQDELRETVCGSTTPDSCGAMGDSLTSYGNSQLWVTQGSYGAHDATFASFWLDEDATEAYQREIHQYSPDLATEQYCCYSHCTALSVRASAPAHAVQSGYHTEPRCIPPPPAGTSAPSAQDPACPGAVMLQGQLLPYESSSTGSCCYTVVVADPVYEEHHYRGRPARIEGTPRFAEVARGGAWSARGLAPAIAALPAETRARLAAIWTEVGRMEHASIAAFANLALRLLAAGAPPELVASTHRAALDEIEHARVAFALASAYAGHEVGPGAFEDAARMSPAGGLEALAVETFIDGCIGETVAAAEAGWASSSASDPAIAGALATIAEDETRHAELAWAIVAWCVQARPELGEALERALAGAQMPDAADLDATDLRTHGIVSGRDVARLRREVLAEVVAPCLSAVTKSR